MFLCSFVLAVSIDCFKNLIQDSFVQHLFHYFLRNLFNLFLSLPFFHYLRESWIHLFIPHTSFEYMSYAYVPGTTPGTDTTENTHTVHGL